MVLVVVLCWVVVVGTLDVDVVLSLFNGTPSWVVVCILTVRRSNAVVLCVVSSCIHWGVDRVSMWRIFFLM